MPHTTSTRRRGIVAAALLSATAGVALVDAPSAGATAEAGSLVIGVTAEPNTLFPWKATQFQAIDVLQGIYGTLTEFDQDLNVVPGLAESWEVSEDGLTVTLQLRQGVTYHDGSSFGSEDVVHSITAIQDEANAAVQRAALVSITGVDAADEHTVVLTLAAPDAALMAALATVNLAILSSDDTEEALNSAPNGTGPYAFSEQIPAQSITLVGNESYWGDGPGLAAIEFRVIPDESSIAAAMQSGNVDFAVFRDPLVAETLGGDLVVQPTPQLSYHVLQLNARNGDLADVNVRLAIQCAIDRQEVLDTAAFGQGEITGPITSPAYRSDPSARPCPERDLDKAAEYLAAAGKADGLTLDLMVSQGEYATSVAEAQSVQAQLAEANITVEIEVLEIGAYVDRWLAGDFQTTIALNGGRPDPDTMYNRYFISTGNLNAVAGYSSDTLDELFVAGRTSFDPEVRAGVYQQISQELEDNAVWIWLFTSYTYTATAPSVEGFVPMASGSLQYLRTTTNS